MMAGLEAWLPVVGEGGGDEEVGRGQRGRGSDSGLGYAAWGLMDEVGLLTGELPESKPD